jgi:TorA maturation chaperone TorD
MKPSIDRDEFAKSAMERSRLYGLLATIFRREPSAEFLCHLKTPEAVVAFTGAGIDLGDEFGTRKFADLADDLAIEYTRLFLGPGKHISPHESVQLKRGSGILWGPETSAVRQAYRAAGFDMGEAETDIPDHICVELDFLSLLAKEEAQAWAGQNHIFTAKFLQLQHSFISDHLGKWAARFCTKVKEEAEFFFYPAFANLLRGFLSGEKAEIVNRLSLIGPNNQPVNGDPNGKHLQSVNG